MDVLIMTAKYGAFALSVVAAWHAMKSMRGWLAHRIWNEATGLNGIDVLRWRFRTLKWLATWAVLVIVGVLI